MIGSMSLRWRRRRGSEELFLLISKLSWGGWLGVDRSFGLPPCGGWWSGVRLSRKLAVGGVHDEM